MIALPYIAGYCLAAGVMPGISVIAGPADSRLMLCILICGVVILLLLAGIFRLQWLLKDERDKKQKLADRTSLQLQAIAEIAHVACFRYAKDGRVLSNLTEPGLWGRESDGSTPLPVEKWVDERDRKLMQWSWRRLLSGETDAIAVRYRAGAHGKRFFEMRVRKVLPEHGGEPEYDGIIQDLTEELAEQRRQDLNLMFKTLLDNLPCAFFVKDADNDFRYLMGSGNYAEFLSTTCNELPGKTDAELFPNPANARNCRLSDQLAMEKGYSDADEEVVIAGETYTFRCIKSRLIREDGRRLLLGLCVDITKEKRLQEELRVALETLKVYGEQEHLLNCCLESALLNEDGDSAIRFVLAMVGEHLKADHAYCFRYDYRQGLIQPQQEWMREGQPERLESMPHFTIDPQEEWFKLFLDHRTLNLPDVSTPEACAIHGRWADLMPKINVHSLYAIGIWRDQELWGHIGLSYTGRKNELTGSEVDLLRSCAHIVEVILERRKNRDELKHSEFEKVLLMDSIRIPIMLFTPDLRLTRCNNAALGIAGITEEQAYRRNCWEIFCGTPCRSVDCPVFLASQDRQMHISEVRIKERDYQLCAYPILLDGALVYIMKTMVDITELNALLKKQQVVNFCLETLLSGNDMNRAILAALEAVCRHLGATRSYIIEFDTAIRTMSCFVEYVAAGWKPIFAGIRDLPYTASPSWEERFRETSDIVIENMQQATGAEVGTAWHDIVQRHHVQSVYARRLMSDGGIWGYLGLVFDDRPHRFTEYDSQLIGAVAHFIELMLQRRRAQEQILRSLKEAQDASKAKSYFLATMSHEIRTPLNAVIGFSELLKSGGLSGKEQMEYLDSINLAGSSLLRLINDVLDLSKLEAEQTVLVPQPTDIAELVHEIQAIFQYKVQEKGLFFRVACPDGLPVIKVDSLRLRQILLNLIGNAVKFTEQGGITLSVDFRPGSDARRGTLAVQVCDTGIGITEEAQHRIFEPFVQSDSIRDTHVYGGTGLGLAISRRMAERMNGKIALESEIDKGSCFTLVLDDVELSSGETGETGNSTAAGMTDNRKIRVLLVDDVPMNLKVLAAMLRKLDIESVCAASGQEALNLLRGDSRFHFVLTDLWMPDMNGDELAKRIHGTKLIAHIPVVAVTADAQISPEKRNVFQGTVLKPITVEALRQLLGHIREKEK